MDSPTQRHSSSATDPQSLFTPITVPGQREWQGKVFPLALALTSPDAQPTVEAGAAYLRQLGESGQLTRWLDEHGAILFRGFGHASPETFSALVAAAEEGRGSKPFEQIGLAGKRNILAEHVFTANEGPQDRRFYQHNEVCRPHMSTSQWKEGLMGSTRGIRISRLIFTFTVPQPPRRASRHCHPICCADARQAGRHPWPTASRCLSVSRPSCLNSSKSCPSADWRCAKSTARQATPARCVPHTTHKVKRRADDRETSSHGTDPTRSVKRSCREMTTTRAVSRPRSRRAD